MFKNLYLAGIRGLLIYVRRGNCVRENGMCTASTRTFLERNKQSTATIQEQPVIEFDRAGGKTHREDTMNYFPLQIMLLHLSLQRQLLLLAPQRPSDY